MASQTKKITLDTAALFFGRAVGLLLGIVRLNYLATYLGVANFGILNFATYFTALFQSLFDLGMAQLMTREISRDPSRSGEYIGRVVVLKLFIVFVASLVVGAFTLISGFDRVTNWAVLLTTVALAINGISMMFLSAFQAHRRMVTVSIANIANDAIISVAIILMIPSFPGVVAALSLTVLVSAINLGVLVQIYLRTIGPVEFKMDIPAWKALLKEGTPMAVSSLAISIYTFIGPTILKYSRGETEVGLFSAGYKLISILTLIPATFSQIVFPIFSDFYKNANNKLSKALQDSLRMMSEISIPLAVGGVILAPRIFSLLYPASFTDGVFVFQVIIAGNAVGYLAQVLYAFLLATDRHRVCMWDTIAVAGLVTVASLIVIPRYGYQSVAVILMMTDLVLFASLLLLTLSPGRFKAKFPKVLRILGSSALMGGLLFLIRDWYLVPVILVATAIYFLSLFFLRSFGDQEREILSKIRRELLNA
jgi:O-antigen/teichoic acid export membrane protein